jgi:tetratricopeptide (TPR) repeat protein
MNYLNKGMPQDAIREFTEADRLAGSIPITRVQRAEAYALAGRTAESHAILADLIRPRAPQSVSPADIASLYIWLGDMDRAMDWLEKAPVERSFNMVYLKVHPIYDPRRQDDRFAILLRRMQFP